MRSRTDFWSGVVRTTVIAGLLVFANGGPSPVAVAQSSPPPELTPFRGLIDHVSAAPNGWLPSSSVENWPRSISGDGRFVVMESMSWDLVPNDQNWLADVFLRDRQTGTTTRLSVGDDGSEGNGMSQLGAISTNGRHVAFASGSSNLVPGDTNGNWDVFVRDLDRGRTVRVSVASGGAQTDADSYWPAISADGRFVAFLSGASTLAPGTVLYQPIQAYLHDRDADGNGAFDEPAGTTTSLVSASSTGGFADAHVEAVRVSADGRFVLFESAATNLDPTGNPSHYTHVYRRDRQSGQTTVIDRTAVGEPSSNGVYSRTADLSDDGRYVTYVSMSTDIEGLEGYGPAQVFRFDATAEPGASTSVVSVRPDGTRADGPSFATSISADGRYVAFTTVASNLATPGPTPGTGALVVRDMTGGTLTRVDVVETGAPFDHAYAYSPAISADGTAVTFHSAARNALNGSYSWGANHVFVATAFAVNPAAASYAMAGGTGSIDTNTTAVSGWSAASLDPWIVLTNGDSFSAGPRTIQYTVSANDAGIVREGRLRVGSTIVSIHQDGDGDVTPPAITPIVTGTVGGDGWYVGNVTVQFTVADPESPIVSQSYACGGITLTNDTPYGSITCEATSHGGGSTQTVLIRRDTTAPVITLTTPAATLYTAGSIVTPSFSCADTNGFSGVATCTISEGATPLDTTPGWHGFSVTATDRAGNAATKRVEYFAGTGVCVSPNENLKGWWRFENNTVEQLTAAAADPVPATTLQYAAGVKGRSWQGQSMSYLDTHEGDRLLATDTLTVAAWLRATAWIGESATIVSKPGQYRIARYPDGTLRWAFNQDGVLAWVNTGVVIPGNTWTHVAVAYDHGLVKTYVNGRLAHAQQLTGTLAAGPNPSAAMTIGGRADVNAFYFGWLDELQVFGSTLSAAEIEAMAMAGGGGLCLPGATTLTVSVPSGVGYGAPFTATATLRNSAGLPRAGKLVTLKSYVSPAGTYMGEASGTTDSAGQVQLQLPMSLNSPVGLYNPGVTAQFLGDAHDAPSSGASGVTVVRGAPAITWPSPSSIVYGTALGDDQFNATAGTAGTFTYTPSAGTFLAAGTHTLGVTFTPSDPGRWSSTTVTTTLLVNKAAPIVMITGGAFIYDKLPHPGIGRAIGVFGESLEPVEVLYDNASQTPPVNAGFNWVSAYYAGSENYTTGSSGNVTLAIRKAEPVVTIEGGPFTFNGQPHPATVTVRGIGGDVLSPFAVLYDGGAAAPVQGGSHTVTVSYNGDLNYEAATVEGALVINKATPIMSLYDVTVTYDGQPHGVAVNVAGVNSDWLTPVVVTYNGSTDGPADAGTYMMEARYDGNGNYNAISRTATLRILKALPYLTWTTPASIVYGGPLGTAQLNATADVPGSYTYAPDAGTVLSAGTHALTATFTPADAVNYETRSASVTLSVSKANASITWYRPQDIVHGTPLGSGQLTATASAAGTLTYSPAAGTVLNTGEQVLSVTFVPADSANYNGGSASVPLTVTKAPATITWPAPADIVYGTALSAAQLNATANVTGTFSYSPALGTVLGAGSRTLSVTFTPDEGANYNGSDATVAVNVGKAASTITWPAPGDIVYGTTLSAAQLNATANLPGNFSYSPALGTVLGAGSRLLSVTFTPDDAANYNGAAATVTVNVGKAASTVTWPAPADIVYGTPLGPTQLNATANVPGSFSYAYPGGTVFLGAGTHALSVTFTPADPANYTGASAARTLTVTRAPLTIAANSMAKPYGVPLPPFSASTSGFVNGDALWSLTGALSFVTPATAGSPVGTYPVTPQGVSSPNYTIAFVAGTLTVVPAATSTALVASPNPSGFNQAVTLTATVSALSEIGEPGGAIQFFDGSILLGTRPLAAGTATLTTNGFAAGGHSLSATYSGDANFNGSSQVQSLSVKTASASSTTTVSSSANPAVVGQSVTLTANISAPAGLSGSVAFYDGGVLIGTIPVFGVTARLNTSALASGGHAITATYLGNASIPPSTSAAYAQHVRPSGASTKNSSIAVVASPSPATLGSTVTLTATVSGSQNQRPTGRVTFFVNGSVVGEGTLTALGTVTARAVLSTPSLPHGSHRVEAVYLGDATYRASTTSVTLVVN